MKFKCVPCPLDLRFSLTVAFVGGTKASEDLDERGPWLTNALAGQITHCTDTVDGEMHLFSGEHRLK